MGTGAGRGYTHKVSPMHLPKHDLNKDDTDGHANVKAKKLTLDNPTGN